MNKSLATTIIARHITVLVIACLVVSCRGSKDVVTFDDSAEYRNAIALPPLKKPDRTKPVATSDAAATIVVDKPASGANAKDVVDPAVEAVNIEDNSTLTRAAETAEEAVSARVIEVEDVVRLEIDGDFAAAWSFVNMNLRSSDITLHTRNKSAGRFAIGCPDEGASDPQNKSSGWSFFNKKPEATDHCSIVLSDKRTQTVARLLNRQGIELSASDGTQIFSRLLNN